MVETENLEGFRVGRILDKMGMKSQDTSELFFEDVRVPAANLLGGAEGQGFYQLMGDLPYERALIAVAGVAAVRSPSGSNPNSEIRNPSFPRAAPWQRLHSAFMKTGMTSRRKLTG